jgi:hypothetical protein
VTLPATPDDDGGATVRYVPVSQILTDAARKRSQELQVREWEALHDELMRRLCA